MSIQMNAIHALTLVVMAKTGKPQYESKKIAQKIEVFFKKCGKELRENYYWTDTDLMALVDIVLQE
jgi:hypothetical protein